MSTEGGEYEEGTEVTITAIADGCQQFVSWSDGDTNMERTVTLNSNVEISAEFEFSAMNEI